MNEFNNDCDTCRFWSDRCAQSIGCGPMEALCLGDGEKKGRMVKSTDWCPSWRKNIFGAIDDLHKNPEVLERRYREIDKQAEN